MGGRVSAYIPEYSSCGCAFLLLSAPKLSPAGKFIFGRRNAILSRHPCRLRHHQKDENAPQLALTLALTLTLSRGERGIVGTGEAELSEWEKGTLIALARTM